MIFLAIRPLNDISISLSLIFRKVSLSADAHPETFQGRKGFVELEHYDKNFVKNTKHFDGNRQNFGGFLLNSLKIIF